MAVSLRNEGIINLIEIDKNFMIITGEIRWRAAKIAEFKKVPCKILEISDNERFIRQVHENIHHNTMTGWDTAKGLEKTIKIMKPKWVKEAKELILPGDKKSIGRPIGSAEFFEEKLSELYGKSQSTISEYYSLLSEPSYVQKALKENKIKRTKIREANSAPEIFRDKLKKKVIDEPKIPRDGIEYIVKSLKRAERNKQLEEGEKILNAKYDDLTRVEIIKKVDKIYPTGIEVLEKSGDRMKKILELTNELGTYLKDNPLVSFASFDAQNLRVQLSAFIVVIKEYLKKE